MKVAHLLSIKDLTRTQIEKHIEYAQQVLDHSFKPSPTLMGKTLVNLFYENSTRTRVSFELAAKRSRMDVVNLSINTSSTSKGETIIDTVNNLAAMGCEFFVIRHHEEGVPKKAAENVISHSHIINAGDGCNEHPSQALLDMLTIFQHKANFERISVGIVGDIVHSRVANSQIAALKCLGCRDIRLIGPKFFLPKNHEQVSLHEQLSSGLKDLDVIITLRIQKERFSTILAMKEAADISDLDLKQYSQQYCITAKNLALAKPDAIVMHPGPLNRELEIASVVADGTQSVILKQVTNGVAMRMAILNLM